MILTFAIRSSGSALYLAKQETQKLCLFT